MALHSQFEGFQAAHREPTVERRRDTARSVLQILDRLEDGGIFRQRGSLNGIGVTGEIFRDAVDDDVRAEFEGLLETGGCESVVDDDEGSASVSELGDGCDVGNQETRVGG